MSACATCQDDTDLARLVARSPTPRPTHARSTAVPNDLSTRVAATLPKVLLLTVCRDRLVKTDGSGTFRRERIELPELRDLLVRAEAVRVHWHGEDFSANFKARLDLDWSVTGTTYRSTAVDLIAQQVADGQAIAEYSTRANFGLDPRLGIAAANQSGTAIESGRLTIFLEVILMS